MKSACVSLSIQALAGGWLVMVAGCSNPTAAAQAVPIPQVEVNSPTFG